MEVGQVMEFDPASAEADTDGDDLADWVATASPGSKKSLRRAAADKIVSAFQAGDAAAVLRHSERVMPRAVRKGIHREWIRATASGEKATAAEFWAANASTILAGRFTGRGSWRAQAKTWLRGATDHVSRTTGLRADAPVLQALGDIVKSG